MIHPTKGGPPTLPIDRLRVGGSTGHIGEFGWTRADIHGQPKRHDGVDFLGSVGEPIYAAHCGTVTRSGWQNSKDRSVGYGRRVYLEDDESGITTVYAHLDDLLMLVGTVVHAGAVIGRLGVSGNSDPDVPHLHFEVRDHGEKINPLWWLFGADGGPRLGFDLDWWKENRK